MMIIFIIVIIFSLFQGNVYATDDTISNVEKSINIQQYLTTFEEYFKENSDIEINFSDIYNNLISGEKLKNTKLTEKILNILISQIKESLNAVGTIFLIVLILSILSTIELDKNSEVLKITKIIIISCAISIMLKNYLEIIVMFKKATHSLSYILELVSTFLTSVLVASGNIKEIGTITSFILFISNIIIVVTNYVIIPLFSISIAIYTISKIGDSVKLDKLSGLLRKTSLYLYGILITVFVFVLSLETTINKSIDGLYYKITQGIVADSVPVVGKFLSDSLDTVLGATELVGKVGGVVSIISLVLIVLIPIVKLSVITILYKLLSAICQPVTEEKEISDIIDYFADTYKDLLGILIGTLTLCVCITGIIMSVISKIT